MTGSIQTGSTQKFTNGWDNIFGKSSASKKKTAVKKKTTAKKKARAKKKATARKKN